MKPAEMPASAKDRQGDIDRMKRIILMCLWCIGLMFGLSGCDGTTGQTESDSEAPAIEDLTFLSKVDLKYARCFEIYKYDGGYSVISVKGGRDYLVVPDGKKTPENTGNLIVIKQPLSNVYMAATSVMALVCDIDSIDAVGFSGTEADGWYIDKAVQAMKAGDISYAGKYSEPDYEKLLSGGCTLAIESTMILHSPDVQEKLEELGINVFIDYSSYEEHPLGRTEWIKVYGAIFGREAEAEQIFYEQVSVVNKLADFENTEKTVAYFYITSAKTVSVKKSSDYFAKMIELAGGRYIFDDLGSDDETKTSTVNMTIEEFYANAKDADYIIYNASIAEPVNTIAELLEKESLLADFKAVQNGNVWCSEKSFYQSPDVLGEMIQDIHLMLTGEDDSSLKFMHRIM